MTATTGTSGIVYTSSSSAVYTEDFALDLYAGSPTGDTEWLKGFGGTYPGSLTGFQASNSDGNATAGIKLVCGRFTTALANDEKLVVGGNASKILAVIVGDNVTESAAVSMKNAIGTTTATNSDGNTVNAAQFTVTGTSHTTVTCWMIVA